ncbi:hypothetical protein PE067_16240 [Paracoccus sp. DMF-8]|uniref:portal protein n=1 Tax=Paracoccus sp. DMF-8 TaxID=3019445 RepID=UPI0023E3585E|nr:hypothetical protein [Paracoccus sp. DMF-8]MDF3607558.1 hypothetical protein [Paracoccus sp. DMF-8]
MTKPKPMSDDEIQKIAASAVESALDFIRSDIEDERQKAQRYFDGQTDIRSTEGRSKVIATKCRDAVRQVKPSLMRAFMTTSKPVEYIPTGPEDVAAAEQQTNYARYAFQRAGGYKLLNSAFHDALVKKTGFLKAWWDESEDIEIDEYSGLTDDVFAMIGADPEVEIIEHTATQDMLTDPMGQLVPVTLHDVKLARINRKGKLAIKPIPPEDFFVDSNATCIEDALCHRPSLGNAGWRSGRDGVRL